MNTRTGCIGFVLIAAVAACALIMFAISGVMSLKSQQVTIESQTGEVWNAVDSGISKIEAIQNQVEFGIDAVQDIYAELASARNDVLAAQRSGDLETAVTIMQNAQPAMAELQSFVEDNAIALDISAAFTTLIDETSGTFNRISVARSRLIEAQTSYNQSCRASLYALICPLAGGSIPILGSNYNAQQPISVPPMGGS